MEIQDRLNVLARAAAGALALVAEDDGNIKLLEETVRQRDKDLLAQEARNVKFLADNCELHDKWRAAEAKIEQLEADKRDLLAMLTDAKTLLAATRAEGTFQLEGRVDVPII